MNLRDGLNMAAEEGLDLVEVAPQAKPPVCRIMDYGKYKYEQAKKAKEARKNQNIINIKEIQVGLKIEEHDLETKVKRARKFLENRDKVKLRIIFRGREITHQDQGLNLIKIIAEKVEDLGKLENKPRVEGRNMIVVISPHPEKK